MGLNILLTCSDVIELHRAFSKRVHGKHFATKECIPLVDECIMCETGKDNYEDGAIHHRQLTHAYHCETTTLRNKNAKRVIQKRQNKTK